MTPPPPGSLAARVRQALDPHGDNATLRALAADHDIEVRTAIAMNPAAPRDAELALAGDDDARVRAVLGARLAALCPGLPAEEENEARTHVLLVLRRLVEDEVERVRAAIAHELQTLPNAPRELILRLARDESLRIADPVIRLSPVLTADDLLALLSDRPDRAASIAGRPMLDARVCDAIVAQADEGAIRVLLENHGAAISEATLDALVAGAMPHLCWHPGMVQRPQISPGAANALSRFVADGLLAQLASRRDLPPETISLLQDRLRLRQQSAAITADVWPETDPSPAAARLLARKLADEGRLDGAALGRALRHGQRRLAIAFLAAAAEVEPGTVQRAANMHSTKGLISLVWKAGWPARLLVPVQTMLGQIAPAAALIPLPDGGFPLSIEEMRWQIAFLTRRNEGVPA